MDFNFRNINFFFLIFAKQSLSLSVDAANANAVNLYRKLGFVELRREKNSITMLLNRTGTYT